LNISYNYDSTSPRASHIYLTDPINSVLKGYIGLNRNSAAGADKEYLSIEAVKEGVHWLNVVLAGDSGNVGIGTTNPSQKLDVNGNVNVAGNLNVQGSISNFSVSSAFQAESNNGTNQSVNLAPITDSFCFLTLVHFEGIAQCEVTQSGGMWILFAGSIGGTRAVCQARCFSW